MENLHSWHTDMSEQTTSPSGGQRAGGDDATSRPSSSRPGSGTARALGPVKTGKDTPQAEIPAVTTSAVSEDSAALELNKKEPLPPIGASDKPDEMRAVLVSPQPADSAYANGNGNIEINTFYVHYQFTSRCKFCLWCVE